MKSTSTQTQAGLREILKIKESSEASNDNYDTDEFKLFLLGRLLAVVELPCTLPLSARGAPSKAHSYQGRLVSCLYL